MAISRFVNIQQNFVLTTFSGSLTNDALLHHMVEMGEVTAGMEGYRELADCTRLTDKSGLNVASVADAGSYKEGRGSRLALLVAEEPLSFGMARAFQTLSSETNEEVEIFKSKSEALEWLAMNGEDLKGMIEFVSSKDGQDE